MDADAHNFIHAIVEHGCEPGLARDTEMLVAFLIEMTATGMVSLETGLHMSMKVGPWLMEREGDKQ